VSGNDETWAKTKKAAAEAGGFTVDLLKDLPKGFIKKQIERLRRINYTITGDGFALHQGRR
jgi:hypothetical protein